MGAGMGRKAKLAWGAAAWLLAAAIARPAAAEDAPPPLNLSQPGIPAEAAGENGVVARDRALAAGRRLAWEKLVAESGLPPRPLPDARIEDLVSSIIIEQERALPTRYAGRITVNFDAGRVRAALGGAAAAATPAPASNWVDAMATYGGMGEWLELQRRLRAAGAVASVDLRAIAVDGARLRLGLRTPPAEAAGELAAAGLALAPLPPPGAGQRPGEAWRLSLARGG